MYYASAPSYEVQGETDKACKLKKATYNLKQSP